MARKPKNNTTNPLPFFALLIIFVIPIILKFLEVVSIGFGIFILVVLLIKVFQYFSSNNNSSSTANADFANKATLYRERSTSVREGEEETTIKQQRSRIDEQHYKNDPFSAQKFAAGYFDVLRVPDGDGLTVRKRSTGRDFRIRLLGIDAPEMIDKNNKNQPEFLAKEAKNLLETLCPVSSEIYIEMWNIDSYGRSLSWVVSKQLPREFRTANELLLSRGLASCYFFRDEMSSEMKKRLLDLQAGAFRNRIGIWSKFQEADGFITPYGQRWHRNGECVGLNQKKESENYFLGMFSRGNKLSSPTTKSLLKVKRSEAILGGRSECRSCK